MLFANAINPGGMLAAPPSAVEVENEQVAGTWAMRESESFGRH